MKIPLYEAIIGSNTKHDQNKRADVEIEIEELKITIQYTKFVFGK